MLGVGQWPGFIEVVHAPTKPALGISPGTKTVYVQIADCEHLRAAAKIGTHGWPQLSPSVKRSSQKRKRSFLHLLVLRLKVGSQNSCTTAHPRLVAGGGAFDVDLFTL